MTDFLPPVVAKLDADIGSYARKLVAADKMMRDFARDTPRHFGAAGHDAGDEFSRRFTYRARESFASHVPGMFRDWSSMMRQAVGSLGSVGQSLGDAFWPIVGGSVLASLSLLPDAISAIGGALGSLPGLAAAAAAAIGALGIGLFGVGDAIGAAFTPASGGGGGSGINESAAAERRYAAAQRDAQRAQQDLNAARRDAVRDLRDMLVQLDRVHLDERGAALSVEEAEQALRDVMRRRHTALDVQRAQLNLEEAQQSLKETRNRVKDLEESSTRQQKSGVEGSDRVQQALERQRSAMDSLASAQESMARAAHGAGGGVDRLADALAGLSPNARAFVEEILRLKPELSGLKRLVQDRLFAGLDRDLDKLAHAWLPSLRKNLSLLAGDWNQLFHRLSEKLSTPPVIEAFDKISGVVHRLFEKFNTQTLDKLVDSFVKLATASTPFIEALGNGIMKWLTDFSDWIDDHAKDGSLDQFFKDAAHNAETLFDIVKQIAGIFTAFVSAISGGRIKDTQGALDGLRDSLKDLKEWMKSPEGRRDIKIMMDLLILLGKIILWLALSIEKLVKAWDSLRDKMKQMERDLGLSKDKFNLFSSEMVLAFSNAATGASMAFDSMGLKMDWLEDKARTKFERIGLHVGNAINKIIEYQRKEAGERGEGRFGGASAGSAGPSVSMLRGGSAAGSVVVQNHNHLYLDGKRVHGALIPAAQRYKRRAGVTGLA